MPDDEFVGWLLLALLAVTWLVAPAASWLARRVVTGARVSAVHHRQAAHRRAVARESRAGTTYWWRGQQITAADYRALRDAGASASALEVRPASGPAGTAVEA